MKLCRITDIPEGESKGFCLEEHSIFLVNKQGKLYAYLNSCPHTGVELDWMPDQFMDISGQFIQCSTHGAQFLCDTGECIAGPCLGQYLQVIPIRIEGDTVYLAK